nr:HepT-like ribonuclease domain-containing protein [Desulfosporosinus sp. I2]
MQWRKIVDLRNIVAHGYGELRMELVWNLSQKEVPALMKQLEDLLKEV